MTSTFTYVRHKTKALKLKNIFDKEHVAYFFLRPGYPTHCNFLHYFFVFACTCYYLTFHDIRHVHVPCLLIHTCVVEPLVCFHFLDV